MSHVNNREGLLRGLSASIFNIICFLFFLTNTFNPRMYVKAEARVSLRILVQTCKHYQGAAGLEKPRPASLLHSSVSWVCLGSPPGLYMPWMPPSEKSRRLHLEILSVKMSNIPLGSLLNCSSSGPSPRTNLSWETLPGANCPRQHSS